MSPPPVVKLTRVESALVARLTDTDYSVRISTAKILRKRQAVATVTFLVESVCDDDWWSGINYAKDAALEALLEWAPREGCEPFKFFPRPLRSGNPRRRAAPLR